MLGVMAFREEHGESQPLKTRTDCKFVAYDHAYPNAL